MSARSLRTFWAIRPPESVIRPIGRLVSDLRPRCQTLDLHVAWVREESMHMTLKFLGSTEEAAIPAMVERVRQGARALGLPAGPQLFLAGLGAFPSLARPSVLFLGVHGDVEPLGELQASLEGWLEELGFAPEERAFHPHLTLGRVRDGRKADISPLQSTYDRPCGEPFVASELTLYESRQGAAGMVYVPLAQVPICGTGKN